MILKQQAEENILSKLRRKPFRRSNRFDFVPVLQTQRVLFQAPTVAFLSFVRGWVAGGTCPPGENDQYDHLSKRPKMTVWIILRSTRGVNIL